MRNEQAGTAAVTERARHRPGAHVLSKRLGDETVLINLQSNRIYELNGTGSRLWELLADGSLEAACARLAAEFDVDMPTLTGDVNRLVEALVADGLLTIEQG